MKHQQESREDTAAEFVSAMYLDRMTDERIKSLDLWLASDPENRVEYQKALDAWNEVSCLSGSTGLVEVLESSQKRSSHKLFSRVAMAASLLLAVVLTGVLFDKQSEPSNVGELVRYETQTGEQQTLTLPDGSVAVINTNSRLLVDFSENRRHLILDRGEVFLEVEKDVNRPFVVSVGDTAVTVLGTKFNVLASGFNLDVAVVEGEVAVHPKNGRPLNKSSAVVLSKDNEVATGSQYRLPAGISARFRGKLGGNESTVSVASIEGGENYPAWRYGMLRFNNQPLYEVVKELNRYSRKKILIEDSRIMDRRMSGVFKMDSFDAMLERFETMFDLQVTIHPDRIVLTGLDAN
ncbi:FecR domain-containing protein [Porticoccaceae bacterium LTM1]|nr:FecR domain-containing protein [Porticoccaceae bacterium LTM1]